MKALIRAFRNKIYNKQNISIQKLFERAAHIRLFLILCILLSVSTVLYYSLYTQQIWEDVLITLRYGENLINGNGLVYYAGERVYGFTSPLGVLLLTLSYLINGKGDYNQTVWVFRIMSILAFAASSALLALISLRKQDKKLCFAFLPLLYAFETKSVAFSANGMETAFMLFFLVWIIFLISDDICAHWIQGGVSWAGLMWTRPDGCVYIAALSFAYFIFGNKPKKKILATYMKMAVVCALLYLPWFIWAWAYYGSPIPHTIIAKLHYEPMQFSLRAIGDKFLLTLDNIFGPMYYNSKQSFPSWAGLLFCRGTAMFSFFYWCFRTRDMFIRTISLAFFLIFFYFFFMMRWIFPWYFPPLAMMGLIVTVCGVCKLKSRIEIIPVIILVLMLFSMINIFLMESYLMRIHQRVIENNNRKEIGLWLKYNIKPQETIYLEPMGYIGYFSVGRILNYPGLVSPRVTQLLQHKKLNFYTLVPELKPDWVIARPWEADTLLFIDYFKTHYRMVKMFSVLPEIKKYDFVPRREILLFDAEFVIFRKIL